MASPKSGRGRVAAAPRGFGLAPQRSAFSPEMPAVVCSPSSVIPAPKSELGVGDRAVTLCPACRHSRGAEHGRAVGTMSCSPGWPVHAARGKHWDAMVGDLGLETQMLPKFRLWVRGCWGLAHGLRAQHGALAPVPKSGGLWLLTPPVPHRLCTPGGRLPPSQQQGGGTEAVGDREAQDASGPGQAAEADGGGLPVAAAGGEVPGEWPGAASSSCTLMKVVGGRATAAVEVALRGWESQISLEKWLLQQPNLLHPSIVRTHKNLMELHHFKMSVLILGKFLNTCNCVLMSFYNAES